MMLQHNTHADGMGTFDMDVTDLGTNDPREKNNWAPLHIGAPEAWEVSTGEDVLVAVLDTGIDYNHVDLRQNIWSNPGEIAGDGIDNDGNGFVDDIHGWNFSASGEAWDVMDRQSHGTHVAGLIAAGRDNREGIVGIAPDAEVMAVKVMNDKGRGQNDDIVRGIDYAIEMGAQIINMSIGGSGADAGLRAAIGRAQEAGVLVVAAAGNFDDPEAVYPAGFTAEFDNVISVASSTKKRQISDFSNWSESGTTVDLAAPGHGLLSTVPGHWYSTKMGTSMAAPVTAAAAAVIWAAQPGWTYRQVIEVLESTVDPISSPNKTTATNGVLNLAEAMRVAMTPEARNEAPTLEVDMLVAEVAEDSAVSADGLLVATLTVEDDGIGVAVVELTGADAAVFEIRDGGLYLRTDVALDYETRPELSVTIRVDDPDLGKGPEATHDVVLAVTDVDETVAEQGGTRSGGGTRAEAFDDLNFWFDATGFSAGGSARKLSDLSGEGNGARAASGERGKIVDGGLLFDGGALYTIREATELSSAASFDEMTISFSFNTGADIDSQQFLYEQGGNKRGLSVTIEDGELHMTGWNLRETKWGPVTVSTRSRPRTTSPSAWCSMRGPARCRAMSTGRSSARPRGRARSMPMAAASGSAGRMPGRARRMALRPIRTGEVSRARSSRRPITARRSMPAKSRRCMRASRRPEAMSGRSPNRWSSTRWTRSS
jgi:subtilisin family serine protease